MSTTMLISASQWVAINVGAVAVGTNRVALFAKGERIATGVLSSVGKIEIEATVKVGGLSSSELRGEGVVILPITQ